MSFKNPSNENLPNNTELDYNSFKEIALNVLSSQTPFFKKIDRVNQKVFRNKEIHQAIIVKSRLRNKFPRKKIHLPEKAVMKKLLRKINKRKHN